MKPIKLLHLANGHSQLDAAGPLAAALGEHGELSIVEHGRDLGDAEALELLRGADVVLTMWGARPIPPALAQDPGRVRYVLNVTGTCRPYVPIEVIRSDIPVTNWGDAPARGVAEGAMALLLAVLKDLRPRCEKLAAGAWGSPQKLGLASGTLRGLRIGLYGCGVIGRRFVRMVEPFEGVCTVFDPFAASLPEGCARVHSLEALFEQSEAVVIWAGLTEQTRGSVTAGLLAKLPDQGIIINAARGAIIDQDALFAELRAGRLRAGLDVLADNDCLPADHEARAWPNLLLSCHAIAKAGWPPRPTQLSDAELIALDNLKRFLAGAPLRFVMDEPRYLLST